MIPFLYSRWRHCFALFALGVVGWTAALFGLHAYANQRGCVSMTNYRHIQEGMDRAEVELLLGSPGQTTAAAATGHTGLIWTTWESGGLAIEIAFDQDGRVVDHAYNRQVPATWWDWVLHRFRF